MMAGLLRDKVTVTYTQKTPDGMGGFTTTQAAAGQVWCSIIAPSGRSEVVAQQLTSTIAIEIRTRPSAIFQQGRTVVHGGSRYLVEAILPTGRPDEVRVLCSTERRK